MLKDEVLQILLESKEYISGQSICECLGVTRAAVWKVIRSLRDEGYIIEASTKRGYFLKQEEDRDILNRAEIATLLNDKNIEIVFEEVIDSTNMRAKKIAEEMLEKKKNVYKKTENSDTQNLNSILILAEEQTAGRGRRGRTWISSPREGIWMSLLLWPDIGTNEVSSITLLASLAAAKAIKEREGIEVLIKWPNDLVLEGKKLCGILTEMSADMDGIRYLVCGIGINVNHEIFPAKIAENTISLRMYKGKKCIRKYLISSLVRHFFAYYQKFISSGSIAFMREEYESFLINKGREVKVLDAKGEYKAKALGINDRGELIVRKKNGSTLPVLSGEVSVRGVYGYV